MIRYILIVDAFKEKDKQYQVTGGAFKHYSHKTQKVLRDTGLGVTFV